MPRGPTANQAWNVQAPAPRLRLFALCLAIAAVPLLPLVLFTVSVMILEALGGHLQRYIGSSAGDSPPRRAGAIPNARIFRYRLLRSTSSTSAVREMLPCCSASVRRM